MKRREFITLIGGAAAGWPRVARAQHSERVRRVGILNGGNSNDLQVPPALHAFEGTLHDLGWVPGRNLAIELRFAGSNTDRMHELAKELVQLKCDVVVAHTTPVVAALQKETDTIPLCS
jgi:putative ABC transport system substrate-binding protein